MIRRPLLPAAALCATLALAACNGSPEAGRPDTTPITTPTTVTPAASPTPKYTAEEEAAITAAKSRYKVARAAVAKAFADPDKAKRVDLEKAGNGGAWLAGAVAEIAFQRDRGWQTTGSVKFLSTSVSSVKLELSQPEVLLTNCIDSSDVVFRYQATGKPVPVGPSSSARQRVQARLVYASASTGNKMWFLIDEKASSKC